MNKTPATPPAQSKRPPGRPPKTPAPKRATRTPGERMVRRTGTEAHKALVDALAHNTSTVVEKALRTSWQVVRQWIDRGIPRYQEQRVLRGLQQLSSFRVPPQTVNVVNNSLQTGGPRRADQDFLLRVLDMQIATLTFLRDSLRSP